MRSGPCGEFLEREASRGGEGRCYGQGELWMPFCDVNKWNNNCLWERELKTPELTNLKLGLLLDFQFFEATHYIIISIAVELITPAKSKESQLMHNGIHDFD